jgi:hypothetical protein
MIDERIRQAFDHLDLLERRVTAREAQRELLSEQRSTKTLRVSALEQEIESTRHARQLLEQLTTRKQELVRSKIEDLITYGIRAVFGPDYTFKIEQKLARNNVAFDYKIIHEFDGASYESDLRGHHGGGLVALVGFLLRTVMVLYSHPPRRRVIFADETMAALDGDKRGPFAKLLTEMGSKLGMQFIIITHSPEYAEDADLVYEIRQTAGTSKLVKVS